MVEEDQGTALMPIAAVENARRILEIREIDDPARSRYLEAAAGNLIVITSFGDLGDRCVEVTAAIEKRDPRRAHPVCFAGSVQRNSP